MEKPGGWSVQAETELPQREMQVLCLLSSSGVFLTFLLYTYFYLQAIRVRPQPSKLLIF